MTAPGWGCGTLPAITTLDEFRPSEGAVQHRPVDHGARRVLVRSITALAVLAAVVTAAPAVAGAQDETDGPPAAAAAVALPDFRPLDPARLADTRPGKPTTDGSFSGGGRVTPSKALTLTLTGRGGVPASGVAAVALNVTVTGPTGAGYLTVHPFGVARPPTSNVNFVVGQTVANSVVTKVGSGGRIVLYASVGTHVIVDVAGVFTSGGIESLTPARLADTRPGRPTSDGRFAGTGAITPSRSLNLEVTGRGGVPASGVTAVALNVTVTGPTGEGYLTVYPSGTGRPAASNLNFRAGQTVANAVVSKVGTDGNVVVYNSSRQAHVVVDVAGYFTAGSDYVSLNPARFADTRATGVAVAGPPYATSRRSTGLGPIGTGVRNEEQLDVLVSGRGGVPLTDTGAVVLNVTVTSPSAGGHLTVFPLDTPVPTASSVNFGAGRTVPNLVIAKLGRGGGVSILTSVPSSHVVVDVLGYFPGVSTQDVPGSYGFLGRDALDMPLTYDRCYVIPYRINPANARTGWVADVRAAFAALSTATGLVFVEGPFTDEVPTYPRLVANHVLVGFTTSAQVPELGGGVIGLGGSAITRSGNSVRWLPEQFMHGFAYFDAETDMPQGLGTGLAFGQVALHELAHVVGLGHVTNDDEIMNTFAIERAGSWGAGDLAGLSLLYRTQGCPGSPATFGALRVGPPSGKPIPEGADVRIVSSADRDYADTAGHR